MRKAFAVAAALSAMFAQTALADEVKGVITSETPTYASVGGDESGSLRTGFAFRATDVGDGWLAMSLDGIPTFFTYGTSEIYTAYDESAAKGAVVGGDMSVLTAPTYAAAGLRAFAPGATVSFTGFSDGWYMARLNDGTTCFLPSSQVTMYDPPYPEALRMYALDGCAALASPEAGGERLLDLPEGTSLTLTPFDAEWFAGTLDGRTVYVDARSVSADPPSAGQAAEMPANVSYVEYAETVDDAAAPKVGYAVVYDGGSWRAATLPDVRRYAEPRLVEYDTPVFLEFARLDEATGASERLVGSWLVGMGSLEGCEAAFCEAAAAYGMNEAYLVAHARLESGNGTSSLATGVWYDPTTDEAFDSEPDLDGHPTAVKVYNMYGIGAYDSAPLYGGAKAAYENGWVTPALAVSGGAAWIYGHYVGAGQATLYDMLWEPGGEHWHCYATDVGWAAKVAAIMSTMSDADSLSYTVPLYAAQ